MFRTFRGGLRASIMLVAGIGGTAILSHSHTLIDPADVFAAAIFGCTGAITGWRWYASRPIGRRVAWATFFGLLVATGGGATKNLVLWAAGVDVVPGPSWMTNPAYFSAAVIGALVGYALASEGRHTEPRVSNSLTAADIFGAQVFAVTTATDLVARLVPSSLGAIASIILLSALCAVGGGIHRDLWILRTVPYAIRSAYGISAALSASILIACVLGLGWSVPVSQGASLAIGTLIALLLRDFEIDAAVFSRPGGVPSRVK